MLRPLLHVLRFQPNRERSGLEEFKHSMCTVLAPWLLVYFISIIFVSTSGVYGPNDFINEDDTEYNGIQTTYEGDVSVQYFYSYQGDYQITCTQREDDPNNPDVQLCTQVGLGMDGAFVFWPAQTMALLLNLYLGALFAGNRLALQKRLGLVDPYSDGYFAAFVPYLCGIFFPCIWSCAICQETRAVKAAWKANNQMTLGKPIMPVQPVPVSLASVQ